jgi:hypothetical protein
MKDTLIKYLRDNNNHRIGVVVALGSGVVGWSKCCRKDKFDKELGTHIAMGRAMVGSNVKPPGGCGLEAAIGEMTDRSQRYYK